ADVQVAVAARADLGEPHRGAGDDLAVARQGIDAALGHLLGDRRERDGLGDEPRYRPSVFVRRVELRLDLGAVQARDRLCVHALDLGVRLDATNQLVRTSSTHSHGYLLSVSFVMVLVFMAPAACSFAPISCMAALPLPRPAFCATRFSTFDRLSFTHSAKSSS